MLLVKCVMILKNEVGQKLLLPVNVSSTWRFKYSSKSFLCSHFIPEDSVSILLGYQIAAHRLFDQSSWKIPGYGDPEDIFHILC